MVYVQYLLITLKCRMQHKLSFLLTVIGQFITAFSTFAGITFLFSGLNAVDGFTYEQILLSYGVVLAAFAFGEMLGNGFLGMPGMIQNGSFDRLMIRPRSVMAQIMFGHTDFARLGLLLQAAIVFTVSVSTGAVLWSWDKIVTLILMIIGGTAVFFGLFVVHGTFAVFTVEAKFMNIFTYGGREFGRYPFSIYGTTILRLLTYVIPMACFQYYPMTYLLDRTTNPIYMFLPLAGLAFLIPCCLFFRYGLRKYRSTGS